jgi:hypothetical protein
MDSKYNTLVSIHQRTTGCIINFESVALFIYIFIYTLFLHYSWFIFATRSFTPHIGRSSGEVKTKTKIDGTLKRGNERA